MASTTKHTTRKKKKPIKANDRYDDLFILRERPISETIARRIADELVEWAINDPDALKYVDFLVAKKINPSTFSKWTKRFEFLAEAKKLALMVIGSRREKGAIKNKYNANMIIKRMGHYDPSWWSDEVQRAELRARTNQKHEGDVTYKIVVDSYKEEDGKETDNMPHDSEPHECEPKE